MSLEDIPTRTDGQNMDETWFNQPKRCLVGVIPPRNTEGEAEDLAGHLGSETARWRAAQIASGYLFVGMIKQKYKYSGVSIPAEPGWMLMDGRQVTEAEYDAEHGAGAWDDHGIAASPLVDKYLPDTDGIYFRGGLHSTNPTQDGDAPITTIGNSGVSPSHNHGGTQTSSGAAPLASPGGSISGFVNADTDHTHNFTIPNDLTSPVTIAPLSVEFNLFMRVI